MNKKKNHKGGRSFSIRERSIIEVRWGRDSKSITEIANELNRNKSSISRELDGRPRKGTGKYNADVAHRKAFERISNRGNVPKTTKNNRLRKRIGDWEDDTLISRQSKTRVKNATERRSGITFFGKTKDGTAKSCDAVLVEKLSQLPQQVLKTLTRDRGMENLEWRKVEHDLGLKVFFAHAYCSSERGTNENTNGLIRRFFPKKTDWSKVSDDDLERVEYLLNTRPRKRHGGLTPVEVFFKATGVAIYS